MAILFQDLAAAYQQLGQGAVRLPPKTTSFKRWIERLTAYAQSPAIQLERFSPYARQTVSLRTRYPAEVEFNYSGQSSSEQFTASWLRGPSDERVRQTEGLVVQPLSSVLGWKGQIRDGQLVMKWSHSEDLLRRETFERIIDYFNAALRSFVSGT